MNNMITKTALSNNTYRNFTVKNPVTPPVVQNIHQQQPLNIVVKPQETENKKLSNGTIKALATIGGTSVGGIASAYGFTALAVKKCVAKSGEKAKQAVIRVYSLTDSAERVAEIRKVPKAELITAIAATTICIGTLCYAITDKILGRSKKENN